MTTLNEPSIEDLNPGLKGLGTYEYGWSDSDAAGASARRGLSAEVVEDISARKNEPAWMRELRLKSLRLFDKKPMPTWGSDLSGIDFQNIKYFVKSTEKQATSWEELPEDIKNTYDRLGIPEAEKQRLVAGVAAQYECLAQDTRVWTAGRGLVPIKDIHPGDRVFAFDEGTGQFRTAPVRAAAQTGVRQTYSVTVNGRTIRATDNHPFLVLEDARRPGRQRARYRRVWKTVGELAAGDLVAVTRGLPEYGAPRAFPGDFGPARSSADLMWFLGFFLGDGNTQSSGRTHRVQFAVVAEDAEVRAELTRIAHEQFGARTIAADDQRLVINSKALVDWLWQNGFAGTSLTKSIPAWVFSTTTEERLAFLGGWVDADGYVGPARSGSVLLTSGNLALLTQGEELALTSGLRAAGPHHSVSTHPQDAERQIDGYRLQFSGDFERLGCRNPKRTDRFGRRACFHSNTTAHGTTFRGHCTEHLGFARVEGIEAHEVEPVWDIEVDGPHNFIAEGMVVHNSEVVYHQIREDLEEKGVIFVDTDSGLREYEDIFREHFATVIPAGDNKFAALNTAVWSGGSFIYVPPGVHVDIPLQAYFRINTENMGQFERTLIIADEGSYVHYVEGCLPAGELITMADGGLRPIESIRVGDHVTTHLGRAGRVQAVQMRDLNGTLHTFTPVSSANAFSVTSEHPLFVVPREEVRVKRARRGSWLPEVDTAKLLDAQPRWVAAKDVHEGDFLVYPKQRPEAPRTRMSIALARLVGYYLAEGHATLTNGHESVVFSFHIDESGYVNEVQDLCKELYDVSGSVRLDEAKHEARVLVYSKALHHAMTTLVGSGSGTKQLHGDLIAQDDQFLTNLVETYVCGDGNITERSGNKWHRAHTVSRVWAFQLQSILARLGHFATVDIDRPGGPGVIMGRPVTRQDLYRIQWTVPGEGRNRGPRQVRDAGEYYLVPIRRREDRETSEPVFNLDVAAPDSYLAFGMAVHNCTAPIYKSDSLHSAVVEIIVKKNARVRYTTIQNWSNNVYNLVTKRATCAEGATMEWIDGNIGSKVTMKYPAVFLLGEHARGETLSIAFAGEGQHQDAGSKMVHAAPNTSSSIVSKSVARGGGRTSYRGLVQVAEGAHGSRSSVVCDALLVDTISRSDTYPYVDIREDDVQMGHEATVSKVSEDQLFYLMSRGLSEEEAMAMIVRGFVEPIAKELPMEYALELNRLIELQMEGAVG